MCSVRPEKRVSRPHRCRCRGSPHSTWPHSASRSWPPVEPARTSAQPPKPRRTRPRARHRRRRARERAHARRARAARKTARDAAGGQRERGGCAGPCWRAGRSRARGCGHTKRLESRRTVSHETLQTELPGPGRASGEGDFSLIGRFGQLMSSCRRRRDFLFSARWPTASALRAASRRQDRRRAGTKHPHCAARAVRRVDRQLVARPLHPRPCGRSSNRLESN